jgi:hypothetical protein
LLTSSCKWVPSSFVLSWGTIMHIIYIFPYSSKIWMNVMEHKFFGDYMSCML